MRTYLRGVEGDLLDHFVSVIGDVWAKEVCEVDRRRATFIAAADCSASHQ